MTLPGAAERGDRTGASLGVAKGDPAAVGTVFDMLLIGAPGESIGSATGTGRVLLRRWRDDVEGVFGPIGGDARGLGFGAALAQAQG